MTPNFDKPWWRSMNARFFIQASRYAQDQTLVSGGKIQGNVMDFAGLNILDILEAFRPILRKESDLLLWEYDPKVWVSAQRTMLKTFGSDTQDRPRLIFGNAFHAAAEINQGRRPSESMIGAFSLDLMDQAREKWWTEQGNHFFANCVTSAAKQFGICPVVLNHTLDGCDTSIAQVERLEGHAHSLLRVLGGYSGRVLPREALLTPSEDLLTKLSDRKFGTSKFGDWAGKVHIYKSKTWRMATIRVYVKPKGVVICGEKELE